MFDIHKISINAEILSLIAEIDEFKGAWKLLGRLEPERLLVLRKIATIESIGSSTRIEGSKLSDKEVQELLTKLKTYSFRSRDEQEVAGYAFTCEEVFNNFTNITFTENVIKQLHGWLLKYSKKDERHKGEYKKFPNHVEAFDEKGKSLGIVFETTSPFDTPLKMQELVSWTNQQIDSKTLHPLLVIGIFIVTFLAIHPFQDGNGRLSRILTTLLLLKAEYLYVPYSSLENVIENNKENYYLSLRMTQKSFKKKNPDFYPWLSFFLNSLKKQKNNLEQKASREKIFEYKLPKLSSEILDLIKKHERLGISELEILTKANRNTIKKHLASLVRAQLISKYGQARATWYTSN